MGDRGRVELGIESRASCILCRLSATKPQSSHVLNLIKFKLGHFPDLNITDPPAVFDATVRFFLLEVLGSIISLGSISNFCSYSIGHPCSVSFTVPFLDLLMLGCLRAWSTDQFCIHTLSNHILSDFIKSCGI